MRRSYKEEVRRSWEEAFAIVELLKGRRLCYIEWFLFWRFKDVFNGEW